MIIDGKIIRDRIKEEIRKEVSLFPRAITLAIVIVGKNPVIESFVNIKKRFAYDVGIAVAEKRFPQHATFEDIAKALQVLAEDDAIDGIVVQLPLPPHFDTQRILNMTPPHKDVDVLSEKANDLFEKGESSVASPVVGAVCEILKEGNVNVRDRKALVVGYGRLVGRPVSVWLRAEGAHVSIVEGPVPNLGEFLQDTDIIVSGVGVAGLIKPNEIKKGVVLIDAGTSEQGGTVVGDADPRSADVAGLFTPVPGGVGPVTVAELFKNLLALAKISQIDSKGKN